MIRLTAKEWKVMEVLWSADGLHLGEIMDALISETNWTRTTVHTYLTRMIAKSLVRTDDQIPKHYYAAIPRDQCANDQRQALIDQVYHGSAHSLVLSFVKDGTLTKQERDELRKLLDEMEV